MTIRALTCIVLISTGFVAVASFAAAAANLETMLPRGRNICYGGPGAGQTNQILQRVRVTRPVRLQSYDSNQGRMVRIVVNFSRPSGARLEDTATCNEKDGEILCRSTSCESAVFALREEDNGRLRLKFDAAIPKAIWSCSEEPLRSIRMTDDQRYITIVRGTGSCLEPGK